MANCKYVMPAAIWLMCVQNHDASRVFQDVKYKVGGELPANSPIKKVKMTINNDFVNDQVTNTLGIIRGSVEPDRYVVVGNHRDAWGFGAIDAASGQAAMINVARAMAKVQQRYRSGSLLLYP